MAVSAISHDHTLRQVVGADLLIDDSSQVHTSLLATQNNLGAIVRHAVVPARTTTIEANPSRFHSTVVVAAVSVLKVAIVTLSFVSSSISTGFFADGNTEGW